ncbi:MAG: hypothetical protein ACYTXI_41955, partial [Nostoc sp.]
MPNAFWFTGNYWSHITLCQSKQPLLIAIFSEETVKKILVIENTASTRNLFLKAIKAKGFYTIGAE